MLSLYNIITSSRPQVRTYVYYCSSSNSIIGLRVMW